MQEYNTATTTTRCTAMSSRYMYGHTSAGGARPCCDCYTKAAVRCDDATTFHEFVQKAREPVLRVAKLLFTLVESSADPSRMWVLLATAQATTTHRGDADVVSRTSLLRA